MSSAPLYLAIVVVWLIVLVPMLLRRDPADSAQIRRADREADDDPDAFDTLDGEDEADDGAVGRHPVASADDAADGAEDAGDGTAGVPRARDGHDDDPDRTVVLRRDELPGGLDGAPGDGDHDEDHEGDPVAMREEGLPPRPPAGRARVIARRRRRTTGLVALFAATAVAVAAGLGPWWVLAPPVVLLLGHLALLREAAKADAERRAAELERARRRRARIRAQRAADEAAREAQILEFMARTDQVYDQYTDAQQRAAGD
ncbi:hypothetical protein ACFOVU_02570 [Nocardiopsis sediminis]|uniref:Uncharacterized protein n=1 Tax=Nocardiopsis sediminis TaxID=1778267 RepID=A0ABV8FIP8_9ACTN